MKNLFLVLLALSVSTPAFADVVFDQLIGHWVADGERIMSADGAKFIVQDEVYASIRGKDKNRYVHAIVTRTITQPETGEYTKHDLEYLLVKAKNRPGMYRYMYIDRNLQIVSDAWAEYDAEGTLTATGSKPLEQTTPVINSVQTFGVVHGTYLIQYKDQAKVAGEDHSSTTLLYRKID